MEELLVYFLRIALRYHVTDIHFSVGEDGSVKAEMRVKGKLYALRKQPADERFFRYLLYRSNMDVSAVMMPQTGSFETEVDGVRLALRFALVSGFHIRSGVLRILNPDSGLRTADLSTDRETVSFLQSVTRHRSGLFLFGGPTGSGKTTTMYTILNEASGRKIYTLEDPVEVFSRKYVQLQVNEKQHLSFADGIRQLMRHDPDIIMIGEIRDPESAATAVTCALTGHVVISSIHAGSCTGTILRMIDLGVKEYQLRDTLAGVTNQRLFDVPEEDRKICVYEYMDRKELDHYFEHHRTSESFIPLGVSIRREAEKGNILLSQAESDLSQPL